ILLIGALWYGPLLSYITLEMIKYKRYYKELHTVMAHLTPKYLLTEVMDAPPFVEGNIFYQVVQDTLKEMHEEVNKYRWRQEAYKEYIESWVHEIKTPIASAQLILGNNPGPISYKVEDELRRMEQYVEQVLYYARSSDASKDYVISAFELKSVVMISVKEESRRLIQKRIIPQIGEFEELVYSDAKWVRFIVDQIVHNVVQYSKEEGGKLIIDASRKKHQVILTITDTGIGIDEKDIGRVWDKGFTGANGRRFNKATGMGLYLCKKLCDKLGIGLTISSRVGEGTTVCMIFPIGENMLSYNNVSEP
ncbi:MAG: sensor histidine kinase, partial [Cellulosilyticaceae bacterium]